MQRNITEKLHSITPRLFVWGVFVLGLLVGLPQTVSAVDSVSPAIVLGKALTNSALDLVGVGEGGVTTAQKFWSIFAVGLMNLGAWITWIGGIAMDHAVTLTITQFGTFVNQTTAINAAWAILRDLANIGIIFTLLAIGIATILQIAGYGMRDLLFKLVVAALLINFSLFLTQVVITVGNAVSYVAYESIKQQVQTGCPQSGGSGLINRQDSCVSYYFMQQLKLTTFYKNAGKVGVNNGDAAALAQVTGTGFSWYHILLVGLLGFVTLTVAGFVFLAIAFLLLARLVILTVLMVLSPLAFMGSVLPRTRGLAAQWLQWLIKEVFFAPALFIMLAATVILIGPLGMGGMADLNGTSFRALVGGDTSSVAILANYLIILGFLVSSLVVARMIGAWGSKASTSWVQKAAGATTFGLAGFAARSTAGRFAYNASNSADLKKKVANGGIRGLIAQGQLAVARNVSERSFDARRVGGMGKKFGLGEGQTGGFKGTRESYIKKEVAYAKSLGKENEGKYTENVLQRRTIFSQVFGLGSNDASRAAAKKITGAREEKEKRNKILKDQQELQQKLREQEGDLQQLRRESLSLEEFNNDPAVIKLRGEIKATRDAISAKDAEREDLRDEMQENKRKEQDSEKKPAEGTEKK